MNPDDPLLRLLARRGALAYSFATEHATQPDPDRRLHPQPVRARMSYGQKPARHRSQSATNAQQIEFAYRRSLDCVEDPH